MGTDNSMQQDFSKVIGIMSNGEVLLDADEMSFSTSTDLSIVEKSRSSSNFSVKPPLGSTH